MIVYNGYPISIFAAITLHSLLLAALLYLQADDRSEVLTVVQPPMVKAILVNENPQVRNEDLLEQQRLVRLDEQRRQEDARRQAREQEQRQQAAAEEQQRRQQQEAEAQRQREQETAAQRERQQQEAEQRRQQELAAEQERKQQAEAESQRQRELAAEQERRRQAEAAATQAAAEAARTEQEMVMSYTSVIHDLVQQNWSRPPSARNGMTSVLRIRMVPTGDVLDVEIVQSSGDPAFDRAAEQAVFRVGQFRELQGMPINLFNNNFRSFLLTFRPEDLLN